MLVGSSFSDPPSGDSETRRACGRLSKPFIRGWRAASAEGLQGNGSHEINKRYKFQDPLLPDASWSQYLFYVWKGTGAARQSQELASGHWFPVRCSAGFVLDESESIQASRVLPRGGLFDIGCCMFFVYGWICLEYVWVTGVEARCLQCVRTTHMLKYAFRSRSQTATS